MIRGRIYMHRDARWATIECLFWPVPLFKPGQCGSVMNLEMMQALKNSISHQVNLADSEPEAPHKPFLA